MHRALLLPSLQPWFVKETAFFFAKTQNLRIRRSRILGIVCRFSPWNVFPPMKPAVWGFGLGLLGCQGFIGAKASLDPLCRAFVAQSFAFAVFATLICQINIVFPCKDTKAAKSVAFCDSLPVFLWHRALRIGTVNLHNMPELYSWKINKRIKYWRKFFL